MTTEIIQARLIKAADVARRLPPASSLAARGYWPSYEHSFEDKAGWGTKRLAEEREMRARRLPPTAEALSRHDEVVGWIASALDDDRLRRILWAWALSQAAGRSFSARCKREGWVRITAYRRRDVAIDAISVYLRNNGILSRDPAQEWLIQVSPDVACISSTLDEETAPAKSPTSIIHDPLALKLPDDQEGFAKHLASVNRQRRREQERRRKLGMDAA